MSQNMLNQLVNKSKNGKKLSYGEGSFWATTLFREKDHYKARTSAYSDNDKVFVAKLKETIQKHESEILALVDKGSYTTAEITPYIEEKFEAAEHNENAGLKLMLQAGIDLYESGDQEKQRFAHHAGITVEQADTAVDILKNKVESINRPSAKQYFKDSFDKSGNGQIQIEAANKVKAIFRPTQYDSYD